MIIGRTGFAAISAGASAIVFATSAMLALAAPSHPESRRVVALAELSQGLSAPATIPASASPRLSSEAMAIPLDEGDQTGD
jgi:hypothetical protein